MKRIKDIIQSNSPLKVGGSTKPENVMEFLQWAKKTLPEGEARRIFALTSTYAKTALETGLEERSAAMQQLAKLNYDKFIVVVPSPGKQAALKAKATAAGRRTLSDMARQQQIAKQLMAR
jgi:hypothetical protein